MRPVSRAPCPWALTPNSLIYGAQLEVSCYISSMYGADWMSVEGPPRAHSHGRCLFAWSSGLTQALSQRPHVAYALPQPPPRGDRLGGVRAMPIVAVAWALRPTRSWCATMHPAAPAPSPTGTALSGHRQLLRALAGWLGGHDAPRSSGGRAHHALYRPASLARCRASNCASAFAMAR